MTRVTRIIAALGLCSCALILPAPPAQSREVIVDQRDRDRPVELAFGDTLRVRLGEPPGSQWRLQNYDASVLQLTDTARVVEVRGRLEREFTFQGVGRGSVPLSFSLVRTGRGGPVVDDEFGLPVSVRGRGPGGPGPGGQTETLVLTDSANGTQVRVSRGDAVVVQLRTEIIKGYHWVRTKGDSNVLRPLGESRLTRNRRGQWVTEFEFRAVNPGRTWMAFNFRNPRVRGRDPRVRDFSFEATVPRWGFGPR
ncbi:MAG: hypothetical protein ACKV19_10125 [Verrucomicrobiales bacterium]